MKKIALLLLFVLCAEWNSAFAQIQEGDLLISRTVYHNLKSELVNCCYKATQLDSLERAYNALLVENELLLYQFSDKLDKSEKAVAKLQADNRKMNLSLQDQKAKTNQFRYAYVRSGRFKERAQTATLFAGLMSLSFLLTLHDNPIPSYIMAGGSAAVTIYLAAKAGQALKY